MALLKCSELSFCQRIHFYLSLRYCSWLLYVYLAHLWTHLILSYAWLAPSLNQFGMIWTSASNGLILEELYDSSARCRGGFERLVSNSKHDRKLDVFLCVIHRTVFEFIFVSGLGGSFLVLSLASQLFTVCLWASLNVSRVANKITCTRHM